MGEHVEKDMLCNMHRRAINKSLRMVSIASTIVSSNYVPLWLNKKSVVWPWRNKIKEEIG